MNCLPEPDSGLMEHIIAAADSAEARAAVPLDSCFDKAVRNVQDLEYYENKNRLRELACGQWLELLSCSWYATGVGEQLAKDMQFDSSGSAAYENTESLLWHQISSNTLEACIKFAEILQVAC